MKHLLFFLLLLASWSTTQVCAQGWERIYPTARNNDFTQTPDGGFLMAGYLYDSWGSSLDKAWIQKTDAEGNPEWESQFDIAGDSSCSYSALQIVDNQHIIAAGNAFFTIPPPQGGTFPAFLHQLDASGNLLKEVFFTPTPAQFTKYYVQDIALNAAGNILLAMSNNWTTGGDHTIIATYSTGLDLISTVEYVARISQIEALPDGSVLMCGTKDNAMYLCKTNATGTILWENTYESLGETRMTQTQDGHIILAKMGRIFKINADGTLVWAKNSVPGYWQDPAWTTEDADGNLLVMGSTNANFTVAFTLAKFDADANLIWAKTPHQSFVGTFSSARPIITDDGGYALGGNRDGHALLMRSDANFNVYHTNISGSMFHDTNDDCTQDASETGLRYFNASATDANGTVWSKSVEPNGDYAFQLPEGNYEISISKRYYDPEYWEPCAAQPISITAATTDIAVPAIGVRSLVDCARPYIRAGILKVRNCYSNTYNLKYANWGTEKAVNVQIEVNLPDFLTYESSNLTLLSQDGQKLVFSVGDLDIYEEGTAAIQVFCSCDAAIGDIACTTFHITPDDCFPVLADWDHSIIEIDAGYTTDQVFFTLENTGTGDMAAPKSYQFRTYCIGVNDAGTFQLVSGASKTLTYPNSGTMYLFEAEKAGNQPYVPGNAAMLWKSGGVLKEDWWHTDTGTPFYAINCEAVTNSFDPNDITVSPRGDGTNGDILATEPSLKYRVRFQNTGNDTAFEISIRDSLPATLDPTSVIPGPSSHAYTFDLNNNVIQFNFHEINLPDSTTDLDASQGYVEFWAKMRPGLTPGTRIQNKASIFFDFNAPVVTNTTLNTIHEAVVSVTLPAASAGLLQVAPNPAVDIAVFRFETAATGQILVMDMQGRTIVSDRLSGTQYQLNCLNISAGTYIVQVLMDGNAPVQGKLVVQK